MGVAFLDRPRMISVALVLLLMVSGCHGDSSVSAGSSVLPGSSSTDFSIEDMRQLRLELLSADEVMSGPVSPAVSNKMRQTTMCGPENVDELPSVRHRSDSNMIRLSDGNNKWVAVGVWDDDHGQYLAVVGSISERMNGEECRAGKGVHAADESTGVAWRIDPVDLGENVVAFRAVEWFVPYSSPAPPTPLSQEEDLQAHPSARALGVVDGKLILVGIGYENAAVPPSEEELRALWNAQVAKLRFHDAVKRSHEVHGAQSGSESGASAQLSNAPVRVSRATNSDVWPVRD